MLVPETRCTSNEMDVDEIYLGKKQKFLSVVCNLETGEPYWFGRERKQESLDGFFQTQLSARKRRGIQAACVDMWERYWMSIEQWAPHCQIIYDNPYHTALANQVVDKVRRTEFFRKGGKMRSVVKGKRWFLLSRWINLDTGQKQQLNKLFAVNRRGLKAYLLKVSLDLLWTPPRLAALRLRVIHQNLAHVMRRDRKEVRPTLPRYVRSFCEARPGFVHKGGRLKRVVFPLSSHVGEG
jgi:transposase